MGLRIFYFFIALFSVSVVFSILETPYALGIDKSSVSIAHMQANDVSIVELNETKTYAKYGAASIIRYVNYDDASNFWALYSLNDELHELSSNQAHLENNITTLSGNAIYKNLTSGLKYSSNSLIYDKQSKLLSANEPFNIEQNGSKMHASSGSYNLNTKQMRAYKVQGWMQR